MHVEGIPTKSDALRTVTLFTTGATVLEIVEDSNGGRLTGMTPQRDVAKSILYLVSPKKTRWGVCAGFVYLGIS